jgi:hypothetical protein
MDVREGSFFAYKVSDSPRPLLRVAYLSVGSGCDQDIDTINLSLLESSSLVLPLQIGCGVQQDPLLSITNVLFVLTTQHALDGGTLKVLDDLVDDFRNVPVLGSSLDGSHGDLGGIVGGLYDIGSNTVDLGRENDSLGVGDGVSVELDTEHDLDDIAILEDDFGIGR